jgi:hypothetical protein
MINRLKVGDPVLIEWEDSYGCSPSWEDLPADGKPESMICRSLGWVVRKSKRCVVIVPHVAENEKLGARQGCGDMTIPNAAIVRVVRLNRIERLNGASCAASPGRGQTPRHS